VSNAKLVDRHARGTWVRNLNAACRIRARVNIMTWRGHRHDNKAPNDIFRYITEELCSVATQYTTSNEVAELRPAPGIREAAPSSGKEASSDVAIHDDNEGAKGSKKCKQCPQRVTTTADDDGESRRLQCGVRRD
jgi:hypothetical protein